MFRGTLRKSVVLGGAGLIAATAAAGIAYAVADNAYAPHSQAAVSVAPDGTILKAYGIESVTRPTVGEYCIKVKDAEVKKAESIPVATLTGGWSDHYIRVEWGTPCGSDDDVFSVTTRRTTGNASTDAPFHWVLP
ncbi:hypothetical protein ACWGN5_41275 [Streptomyces sp. NPDC055815]